MGLTEKVNADGLYTRADAARLVGRHPDTIRRWEREGLITPQLLPFGQLTMPAFTPADVAKLQDIAAAQKLGRPKKAFSAAARDPRTLALVDIDTLKRRGH
jgi:DNA-binding transcriptional MerR regulator